MNIKRSQMQNLIIYLLDILGIILGYFIMIFLRFRETMKKSL